MKCNKKALVIGGTGAMGVYLIPELLRLGYEVFVTSRSSRVSTERSVHFIQGNAKDDVFLEQLLASQEFDIIVDFMVYTTDEFKSRATALLNSAKHYLFLSSYRVYADSGENLLNEESPRLLEVIKDKTYLATDEYGLSKARQENVLKNQKKYKHWTILRPGITYSKDRFQLGNMEAEEFVARALKGEAVLFPRNLLDKYTTMTWAGDVAKMIARLAQNEATFGQTYTLATSEYKKWSEIIKIYKEILGLRVKIISPKDYIRIVGRPYQIKYDRAYNRKIDNNKILRATGIDQGDLMPIRDGLRIELSAFSKSPNYRKTINSKTNMGMDIATASIAKRIKEKIRLRTRLCQLQGLIKSRLIFDGAIVTLTVYNNYGNVIQRYALQRFLKKNGYRFTILDLKQGPVNQRHLKLKAFVDQYLEQDTYHPQASKFYKSYIVGSDQVWRHFSVNKGWERFGIQFLDFVSNGRAKRIAYSASFGVDTLNEADIDEGRKRKIRPLIERFNAISVRESSAIKLVNQLGGDEAVQTLDPTLLLKESDYTKLIKNSSDVNKKSHAIFYYLIQQTPLTEAAVQYYEKKFSEQSVGILPYEKPINNIITKLPSVEEWLKSIKNAQIVVTDSYHAVIFSIIFHTDFIVFDKQLGGLARIAELLEPLGLSDRIVIQGYKKKYIAKYKPIDWRSVDKILEIKRQESSDWLLGSLLKD